MDCNLFRERIDYLKDNLNIIVICLFIFDSLFRISFSKFLLPKNIFIIITTIITIIFSFINYKKILKTNKLLFATSITMMILITCSIIYNHQSITNVYSSICYQIIWIFLIFYNTCIITNKEDLLKIFKLILTTCWFSSFVVTFLSFVLLVIETFIGIDLGLETWTGLASLGNVRLLGITGNPAQTGLYAFITMISAFCIVDVKKMKEFILLIVNSIISFIVLLFCDARSSMLALLFIIILIIGKYGINKLNELNISRSKKIFISIIVILIMLFLVINITGVTRSQKLDNLKSGDIKLILNSLSSNRFQLWYWTIEMIKSSPFFGIGIDNFTPMAQKIIGPTYNWQYAGPHNVFLDCGVSIGIGGMIICGIIYVKSIISNFKVINSNADYKIKSASFLCLGLMVIALFEYGILFRGDFYAPVFWACFGLAISYCRLYLQ